jgi:redox-sensitive bicupin YhaK (pirin superfamily)
MVEPYFTMLWNEQIPRHVSVDGEGRSTEVTVVAGALAGLVPPPAPPSSWASKPDADLAIWHLVLEPGATWTVPPAQSAETVRTLYTFEGAVRIGEHSLEASTGAVLRADVPVEIAAGPYGAEALVLQGRPIGEPVAQYGPFVMNTQEEIQRAFVDYRATGFGGWPWPIDDPVHPREAGRFARHADGRLEEPDEVSLRS